MLTIGELKEQINRIPAWMNDTKVTVYSGAYTSNNVSIGSIYVPQSSEDMDKAEFRLDLNKDD